MIVLRAGDVIPQVLSPAPHVAERDDRPAPPRPPEGARSATPRRSSPRTRCSPAARTATARAGAGSCSSTSRARWTSTAWGRSRSTCSWSSGGYDRRRFLRPGPPSRSPTQPGFGQVSAEKLVGGDRGVQAPAVRSGAVRARDRGGRLRHRSQPGPAVPDDRRAARRRPEQIEQTQGVGPKMAATIHEQLQDQHMRKLIDATARARAAVRGGGAAARRGPARRQDVRADRDAAGPDPRAGDRADHRRRRAGHRVGVAQDRLCRRGRERGLEARPGRAARRAGARRGRACGRCSELAASRCTSRAARPSASISCTKSGSPIPFTGTRTRACGRRAPRSSRRGSRRREACRSCRGSRPAATVPRISS